MIFTTHYTHLSFALMLTIIFAEHVNFAQYIMWPTFISSALSKGPAATACKNSQAVFTPPWRLLWVNSRLVSPWGGWWWVIGGGVDGGGSG